MISTMGLQATATKRKYEFGLCSNDDTYLSCTPAKSGKWSSVGNSLNVGGSGTPSPSAAGQQPHSQLAPVSAVSSLQAPSTVTTQAAVSAATEDSIAKLEAVAAVSSNSWNVVEPIVDSISKLQAVAVPGDTWGSDSKRSTLATTLLSADELDDDEDDFEDEFEEDESIIPTYCPMRYPCLSQRNFITTNNSYTTKPNYYSEPFPQQNCSRTANQHVRTTNPQQSPQSQSPSILSLQQHQQQHQPSPNSSYNNWQQNNSNYYTATDPYPQQTIRCAENGKSYLELGSSNFNVNMGAKHPKQRCCDGRGTWCNSKQCYKEIRLKIRNLSMFKLSRFRQVTEQSLYRSVLICNTLKYIDKEIESEEKDSSSKTDYMSSPHHQQQQQQQNQALRMPNGHQPLEPLRGGGDYHQQNHFRMNSDNSNLRQHQSPQAQAQQQNFIQAPSPRLPNLFNSPQAGGATNGNGINSNSNNSNNNSNSNNNLNNGGIGGPGGGGGVGNASGGGDLQHQFDHYPFRDSQSGRATPFPTTIQADNDSGYGDEDCNRSINWSSVLSLSAQSALDPLNNNDLFATTTTSTTSSSVSSSLISQSITTTTNSSLSTQQHQQQQQQSTVVTNNVGNSFITTPTPSNTLTSNNSTINQINSQSWEYNFLDMDLGLGPEFTELLPSWKISSDDMLKSVSVTPSLNTARLVHETELETPTHIMVGS